MGARLSFEQGARAALARRAAVHAGIRMFRFFSRPLGGAAPLPPAAVELRLLDEDGALRACADPELELSAGKVRAAFARGDLCAAALDASTIVGYCWVAFGPVPHLDNVWVDFLRPQAMWQYKSFVRPSHRGRGIAPALYRLADSQGMVRGATRALICVESHNLPSVAAAGKSGYASAGYAAYRVSRERLLTWYSPQARANAIRFYVTSATAGS